MENLFDPGVAEEPWVSLENGLRYASGDRDIEIRVQNYGEHSDGLPIGNSGQERSS